MESRSSNIKINFDVNGASVQRTKDAINSIQSSAEKLSKTLEKTLDKISKTMDAKDKRPGADAKKSFSIMEKILGNFDYKASEKAMASVSSSIQRFVDRSIKDINRLKAAQDEVLGTKPDNIIGGKGWSYNMSERVGPIGAPTAPHVGGFEQYIKSMTPTEKFLGPYAGRSFWGAGGFEEYMRGRGEALGSTLGLGQPGATVLGAMGGAVGKMGLPGAVLAGSAYVANKAFEAFDELRPQQVNYTLDRRFMELGAASAKSAVHNRVFNAIQGKDVSYLGAYRSALDDKEIQRSLNNAVLNREAVTAVAGIMPVSLKGKFKNAADWMKALGSGAVGTSMEAIDGSDLEPTTRKRAKEILYEQAAARQVGKQMDDFQQGVAAYHQFQGGIVNTMSNRIAGDWYGRHQAMIMGGKSTNPGPNGETAYEMFRSQLLPGGWDVPDWNQGYQAMLGAGKGYMKVLSPTWGVVGGHMAGLRNIEQIVSTAGTIGGSVGQAGRMKGVLQGSTGAQGLDVAVANKLFTDILGSINATGQWGTGNTAAGYSSLLAGMVSGGYDDKGNLIYDVGGQQRRAQMFNAGNTAYQKFVSGTAAPVFNAMSLYTGIEATGGTWGLGSEVIRNTDVRELASIVKGGDISDYYRFTLGDNTTKEGKEAIRKMAETQLKGTNRNLFGGVKTASLQDPEGRKFLTEIKDAYSRGGNLEDVLEDRTKGIKDKREKVLAKSGLRKGAAGILSGYYQNMTNQAAEGLLEAGSEYASRDWSTKLHGQGVGVSPPKGLEGEAAKEEAKRLKTESQLGGMGLVAENTAMIVKLLQEQNRLLQVSDVGAKIPGKMVPKNYKDKLDGKEGNLDEMIGGRDSDGAWGKGQGPVQAVPIPENEQYGGMP